MSDDLAADIKRRGQEVAAVALAAPTSESTARSEHVEYLVAMWDVVPVDSPAWRAAQNLLAMFDRGGRYGSSDEERIGRLGVIGAPLAEFVTAAMEASFEAEEDDQGDAYYRMEHALQEVRRRMRVLAPLELEEA
jgi:hypothetical protein